MVSGGSLDHQKPCFPKNLKGSVPGIPDANLVQLFKSLLGQAFQQQSLESPWRSLEDPWRVPGRTLEVREASWQVPGGPWRCPGESLPALWRSPRVPTSVLKEVPGRSLEGPWITKCIDFLRI